MKAAWQSIVRWVRVRVRRIAIVLGWIAGVLAVVNGIYYFVSAYSPICGACHYMEPHYRQWKESVHNGVACVDCHPSRRLFTGPYLLRYIAGGYNSRPRANVASEICLNCHGEKTLETRTTFKNGITFNHKNHLGNLRRGKQLRCTSCHGRGMSNEHFTVDEKTCFLCHFKGAERGHSVTGCITCHSNPKQVVQHEGFEFNHESYLKSGVQCSQCHIEVATGSAGVDSTHCYDCHAERLQEFSNVEKIHSVHITQNGIDCFRCHGGISHGKVRMIRSLEAGCDNCHGNRHTPQREMYLGTGAQHVESTPSRMFAAQVACEGCHLDVDSSGTSELWEKRIACVKCHEPGYDKMLDRWISEIGAATREVGAALGAAEAAVARSRLTGAEKTVAASALAEARDNYRFLTQGRGPHNVDYAVKIIDAVAAGAERALRAVGQTNAIVRRPDLVTNDRRFCDLCHSFISVEQSFTWRGEAFPHGMHGQNFSCSTCHARGMHKKLALDSAGCDACHARIDRAKNVGRFGSIEFPHDRHAKEKKIECVKCHTSETDFKNTPIKKAACAECHHTGEHAIAKCERCHLTQSQMYAGTFLSAAPQKDVMNEGGVGCEGCHRDAAKAIARPAAAKCAECHDSKYPPMMDVWQSSIDQRRAQLSKLVDALALRPQRSELLTAVHDARRLLDGIRADGSRGVHNYELLSGLLDKHLSQLRGLALPK